MAAVAGLLGIENDARRQRAADAQFTKLFSDEHALHFADADAEAAERHAAGRPPVLIGDEQRATRLRIFAGQSSQLVLKRAVIEIAIDERDVFDMPRPVPGHKAPHESADIVEFGRCRGLNDAVNQTSFHDLVLHHLLPCNVAGGVRRCAS